MSETINRPLPLQGANNVRELGGYRTSDGRRTKEHVFLRADGLDGLTGKDRHYLRRYPVGLVVDLRSRYETRLAPDKLDKHFEQHHVPMFDHVQSELARRMSEEYRDDAPAQPVPTSLAEIYILLAETEKEEIRTVLKMLVDADKPALFHCTAGKDRTGTIAMCLLEMAGVPEETILDDYAATARYLGEAYGFGSHGEDGVPEDAYDSRPEIMRGLRDHLKEEYGSMRGYLHDIGITDDDIARLREKFTEPA